MYEQKRSRNTNCAAHEPQDHTPQSHRQNFNKKCAENPRTQQSAFQEKMLGQPSKEKGYKKLIAWQKADALALKVYKTTNLFPRDEMYGVRSQLRRAALSVPTNLVEGNSRQNRKEFKQYVNIALGSLSEVEYLLDFSLKLGYFTHEQHRDLCESRNAVGGLLWKLHRSITE